MIDALVGSEYFVLLMFPGVLLGIFLGYPVAFSLMGMSLIFGYFSFGDAVGAMLVRRVWDIANNYVLAAVPLFVFMGSMLEASGIASRLFEAMIQWTGRLRGGMAIGTVIMCTIFAAATGIIGAAIHPTMRPVRSETASIILITLFKLVISGASTKEFGPQRPGFDFTTRGA